MQSYYKRKIEECYESARQANEVGNEKEMNYRLSEASNYEQEIKRIERG